MVEKQSEVFHTFLLHFFPSLKQNFIAYRSSKVSSRPDFIFEIHQLWQSDFSRVHSNCCCSWSFEPEIIKIGQSSHKMYSNNIVHFQESTTSLNACTQKVWKHIEDTAYNELSSLVRSIPKHNVLVIGGDMNAQIGKNVNHEFSQHNSSNRNVQHLTDSTLKDRLTCLNTNFQKREGKPWTYTNANNTKAKKDYVFINKKWNNSVLNCEAYSSFESVSSDHRIVMAKYD